MRINQLVEKLKNIEKENGDIEVKFFELNLFSVDTVKVSTDNQGVKIVFLEEN